MLVDPRIQKQALDAAFATWESTDRIRSGCTMFVVPARQAAVSATDVRSGWAYLDGREQSEGYAAVCSMKVLHSHELRSSYDSGILTSSGTAVKDVAA